jgi:hypothetical protein
MTKRSYRFRFILHWSFDAGSVLRVRDSVQLKRGYDARTVESTTACDDARVCEYALCVWFLRFKSSHCTEERSVSISESETILPTCIWNSAVQCVCCSLTSPHHTNRNILKWQLDNSTMGNIWIPSDFLSVFHWNKIQLARYVATNCLHFMELNSYLINVD